MKEVYRCDFCDTMGTRDEIREHEATCTHNPHRCSCLNCGFSKISGQKYQCTYETPIDIPEGKMIKNCKNFSIKDESIESIFYDLFSH